MLKFLRLFILLISSIFASVSDLENQINTHQLPQIVVKDQHYLISMNETEVHKKPSCGTILYRGVAYLSCLSAISFLAAQILYAASAFYTPYAK